MEYYEEDEIWFDDFSNDLYQLLENHGATELNYRQKLRLVKEFLGQADATLENLRIDMRKENPEMESEPWNSIFQVFGEKIQSLCVNTSLLDEMEEKIKSTFEVREN